MRSAALLALVLIATPVASHAEGCPSARDGVDVVQHIFDEADHNQDGRLSRVEYEEAGLQHYGVSFDESDTNADGATTMDEYLALYERHHPPVSDDTEV